ncbi:MAG TPA: gas vesicle protein [Solirubrobacteraceae bacterium]|nr:gas vesicle protein [Solirubrobacteraceae bacterium]
MPQGKRSPNRASDRNGRVKPAELAQSARKHVAELTGRVPESVLGLRKDDDGWKVTVEVVELSRVPNSTDLLGCYVVTLDDDGELLGYERVRRYQRGQTGGEDG